MPLSKAKKAPATSKKEQRAQKRIFRSWKEVIKKSEDMAHQIDLNELVGRLQWHPDPTSAMLCQVRAGSQDSGSESDQDERLPPYQNKLNISAFLKG